MDFVVIGAEKSGTTWLKHGLNKHPDIFIPAKKEIHFFDQDENFERGTQWLDSFFEGARPNTIKGEITPNYMWEAKKCASRIQKTFPEIKLIAIFRNPISRAISNYHMLVNEALYSKSLNEVLTIGNPIIGKGKYKDLMEPFLNLWNPSKVLLLNFDDIAASPHTLLNKVFKFLDVESGKEFEVPEKKYQGGSPRLPWINKGLSIINRNVLKKLVSDKQRSGLKRHATSIVKRYNVSPAKKTILTKSQYDFLKGVYEEDICFLEDYWALKLDSWRNEY